MEVARSNINVVLILVEIVHIKETL